MRHRRKNDKLSRSRAQRKALVKSLLRSLIIYERIVTTQSKAKQCRRVIDRLIEWGKKGTLHHRRLSYRLLGDHKLVKKLFDSIAPRFKNINGGYTRIFNLKHRKGDGAKMSILEFTIVKKEEKKSKKKKEAAPEKEEKKEPIKSEEKTKKNFISGIRKIFKKEKNL
jgi:large subunit ribosomal protein L17